MKVSERLSFEEMDKELRADEVLDRVKWDESIVKKVERVIWEQDGDILISEGGSI